MNEENNFVKAVRYDSIPLAKAKYTDEGYLMDTPILTSTGIFEYKNDDGSIRRELRLPEHVFNPESLASYKGKPIIVTHDAGVVNKNNVNDESVGTILSDGYRDGDNVRAEIIVHDTIELKRCGLKELSLGYTLDLIEEPGEWNGEHYDAIQTNIFVNHLALVKNARAGEQARLNIDGKDEKSIKGGKTMAKTNRKDQDDIAVELAEAVLEEAATTEGNGAAAVDSEGGNPALEQQTMQENNTAATSEEILQSIRDRKDRRDSEQETTPSNLDEANEVIKQQNEDIDNLLSMLEEQKSNNASSVTEENKTDSEEEENKDSDDTTATCSTEKKDSEAEEKPAKMNADSIDTLIRARAAMNNLGEKFNIDGLENLSMADAMRKVISFATPGIRLDSEDELKGAFKVAVATLNSQKDTAYQRRQMCSGVRTDSKNNGKADDARERMIKRMRGEK